MPDTSGKTHSLVEEARLLSLSQVRDEYNTRMVQPSAEFKLDSTGSITTTETSASILIRNMVYDNFILVKNRIVTAKGATFE